MKKTHLSKSLLFLLGLFVLSAFTADRPAHNNTPTKNIIVLVANGMGVGQLTAARMANGGTLNLDRFTSMGLLSTQSAGKLSSDAAAAATAIACGVRTKNGYYGVDKDGEASQNLFEWAQGNGMKTGLITMGSLADNTHGAYLSHTTEAMDAYTTAEQVATSNLDVIIGGGQNYFSNRPDKKNLTTALKQKGYKVYKEIKKPSKIKGQKVAVIAANNSIEPAFRDRGDLFMNSWEAAKNVLPISGPYLVVVTDPHIEAACASKNLSGMTDEIIDFDKVVGNMMEHARMVGNTLILVVGDREVGGLSLREGDAGGLNAKWTAKGGTVNMVPIFAYGAGADAFSGQYANTEVYHKLVELVQ